MARPTQTVGAPPVYLRITTIDGQQLVDRVDSLVPETVVSGAANFDWAAVSLHSPRQRSLGAPSPGLLDVRRSTEIAPPRPTNQPM